MTSADQDIKSIFDRREPAGDPSSPARDPSPPLLGGDPDVIRRQRNMLEIESMFSNQQSIPPQLQPRSCLALPRGFLPNYAAYQASFESPHILNQPSSNVPNSFSGFPSSASSSNLPSHRFSLPFPSSVSLDLSSPTRQHQFSFNPANGSIASSSSMITLQPKVPERNSSLIQMGAHSTVYIPSEGGSFIGLNQPSADDVDANRNRILEFEADATDEKYDMEIDQLISMLWKSPDRENEVESAPPERTPSEPQVTELRLIEGKNSYAKQMDSLAEYVKEIRVKEDGNVFFYAPTVDYFTTTIDSVKFIVYRDETWPAHIFTTREKVVLTYDVDNVCGDLLVAVLFRFLEDSDDAPSIDEFTLKLHGTDEFLDPTTTLANLPYIGELIARNKDVTLTIGRKIMKEVKNVIPETYQSYIQPQSFTVPRDRIQKILDCIHETLNVFDAAGYTSEDMRKKLTCLVSGLCKLCHNVMISEVATSLNGVIAADIEAHFIVAKKALLKALYSQLDMYCEATHSGLKLAPIPDFIEDLPIVDLDSMRDMYLVYIEGIFNMPKEWRTMFSRYYIEVCVMFGTKSVADTRRTGQRSPSHRHNITCVRFSEIIDTHVSIMLLPREAQLVVLLFGVPMFSDLSNESGHQLIGCASFPIFDDENFMLTGKVAIPLTKTEFSVVEPWGPTPVICSAQDVVVVVGNVETPHRVRFPTIEEAHLSTIPFNAIENDIRNNLLDIIEETLSHTNLHSEDKPTLWANRHALTQNSEAYVLTLASAINWDYINLSNIYPLLKQWKEPTPQQVLEILLPYFQDRYVRARAVEILSKGASAFLIGLLPQLVEALRFEIFEHSALAKFLLKQATKDRRFATVLYWELHHRANNEKPPYCTRCYGLLVMVIELKIPKFDYEVACQKKLLKHLDVIYSQAKTVSANEARNIIRFAFSGLNDFLSQSYIRLSINPGFIGHSFDSEKCGVFTSLTRPLKLVLQGSLKSFGVIYKIGDDLRQDATVLQLVSQMNDLWLSENLNLRMLTYRIQPTASNKGFIELVENCVTFCDIQNEFSSYGLGVYNDSVIERYISRHNTSELNYNAAKENFLRSSAGWCVATYLLGIGDRHNDNIAVTESGRVFHIDFGKYMGDTQTTILGINRDRAPFVLTKEMLYVINGGADLNNVGFQEFVDCCTKAYMILRRNCRHLLNIIRFVSCSTIPSMNINSVNFVHGNLHLEMSDQEATVFFSNLIREAAGNPSTRLNFFAHSVAQRVAGGRIAQESKGYFGFTTEIYTSFDDAKILYINIKKAEKWWTPEKVYMYGIEVYRQNEKYPTYVYRSYEELSELHRLLCNRFTEAALPVWENTGALRTNVASVAQHREICLQHYFMRFFELSHEITQCDLVYTFFHAFHRDTSPEDFRNRRSQTTVGDGPPILLLSMSVEAGSSKLNIFIKYAKNLPVINTANCPPDAYVKLYLSPCGPGKESKRKTNVAKASCNPVFNHPIEYFFDNQKEMKAAHLHISIWHSTGSLVRDNYALCDAILPVSRLFEKTPDRKGTHTLEDWIPLNIKV